MMLLPGRDKALLLRKVGDCGGGGHRWELSSQAPGMAFAEREHQNQIVCLNTWPAARHPCLHLPPFLLHSQVWERSRTAPPSPLPPWPSQAVAGLQNPLYPNSPSRLLAPHRGLSTPFSHSTGSRKRRQGSGVVRVYAHMFSSALVTGFTGLGAFLGVQMCGQPPVKPYKCPKGGELKKMESCLLSFNLSSNAL